jgi:hypothetical protein
VTGPRNIGQTMAEWLIDETSAPTESQLHDLVAREQSSFRRGSGANLAVRLNDVVVHDTKKWFGGAELRLDAIVVHGPAATDDVGFYQPSTLRFQGVRDGDRLPIEHPGLLAFYGRPRHFVDISIVMSRDRKDSEDLRTLIGKNVTSDAWQQGAAALLGLAVAAPQAAAIAGALGGAAVLANFAAELLANLTGDTIGVYRSSFLQTRDRFGLGRHPQNGSFRQRDLSFWFDVVLDREAQKDD